MYTKLLLPRRVLITPDEVVKLVATTDKLDPRMVWAAIEIAEERFVRKSLGWALYEEIGAAKNTLVTEANKAELQAKVEASWPGDAFTLEVGDYVNSRETLPAPYLMLWNERLWKFVAECVHFVMLPQVFAQLSSQGLMKNNPIAGALGETTTKSVGVDLKDVRWLMDKSMSDRIDVLQDALHEYLCYNVKDFPSYVRAGECEGVCGAKESQQTSRRVTWLLDIYGDDD